MKRIPIGTAGIPLILVLALTLGLLVGCSGNSEVLGPDEAVIKAAPYENTGTLKLNLIDSPVDFDDFILVLRGISAHRASGDSLDGWFKMEIEPTEYFEMLITPLENVIIGEDDRVIAPVEVVLVDILRQTEHVAAVPTHVDCRCGITRQRTQ